MRHIVWISFLIFCAMVSIGASLIASHYDVFNGYVWLVGVGTFLIPIIGVVRSGMTSVPENHEYTIEVFGKYVDTWDAGLHFLFPLGGVMSIGCIVYKGTQTMKIFGGEGKDVDFKDGSAPIEAFVHLRLVDSKLATYAINDVFGAVADQMESVARSYLSGLKLEEANTLKNQLDLEVILREVMPTNGKIDRSLLGGNVSDHEVIRVMREEWGVEIDRIIISDIILSEKIIELRAKLMEMEKRKEVAAVEAGAKLIEASGDKNVMVIRAKGEKEALALVGAGLAEQVKAASKAGLLSTEAAHLIVETQKWKAAGGENNTLIIEGGGTASAGAAFGFGQRLIQAP